MILKLLGYAPDADPSTQGVIVSGSGFVPSLKGMKGAPTPASTPQTSLGATCMGAATLYKLDLSTRFFAGTATQIFEAGVSTWTDVSASTAYGTAASGRWRFAQQNNNSLAANGADTVQVSVSSGNFSSIPGAPIANIVEVVGSFVFAVNTSANSNGVQWAGINGYSSWASSIATQAGSTTLTSTPGPNTAGRKFGNSIVVYKKNSMYLGVYSGPPNIWDFVQIPGIAGAMSQEVVVNVGTPENPKHIFMGEDNFYLYDGSKPIPIGTNRNNQTVFGALLQSRYYACTALHDKKNFLVYFYYPVADSTLPDHCVVYNYMTDKWGVDDRQIQATTEYITPGITYTSLGGFYATYDSLPNLPYDSAFLNSALGVPAIFDTMNNVKSLTGAAANTSITVGDIGDDKSTTTLNRIRPRFITAPSAATWTPAYRMNLGDALSTDTAVSLSNGAFDFQREARWHRGTMALTGDWEVGVLSVEGVESGLE